MPRRLRLDRLFRSSEVDFVDFGGKSHLVCIAFEFNLISSLVKFALLTLRLVVQLLPLVAGGVVLEAGTLVYRFSIFLRRAHHSRLERALLSLKIFIVFLLLALLTLLLVLLSTIDQVIFISLSNFNFVVLDHVLKDFLRLLVDEGGPRGSTGLNLRIQTLLLPLLSLQKYEVCPVLAQLLESTVDLLNFEQTE